MELNLNAENGHKPASGAEVSQASKRYESAIAVIREYEAHGEDYKAVLNEEGGVSLIHPDFPSSVLRALAAPIQEHLAMVQEYLANKKGINS